MSRIAHEKKTVEQMIRLYCRLKEGNRNLCPDCQALLVYAHKRLDHCKFGERKSTCRDSFRLAENGRYSSGPLYCGSCRKILLKLKLPLYRFCFQNGCFIDSQLFIFVMDLCQ